MNYNSIIKSILFLLIVSITFVSCKSGPLNVFKPASPHEAYKKKLIKSGFGETAIGKSWIDLSEKILQNPVAIKIPYLEKGYFPAEKVQAAAFSFKMEQGQKLNVRLTRKPSQGFNIYTDIWEQEEGGLLKPLGFVDTLGSAFQSDIERTGTLVIRLQPELLAGGEYTLEITSVPSLDYPLGSYQDNQIRSFWGDGRDAGSRKHEGVDIFSRFRTPVLASASGSVRVNENNLGGKVVWLRPEGKDYTLYYAHLDEQIVSNGQSVQKGDTLGLMGNTGNARSTPPHLHFGIYARGGAVDPLPFINPKVQLPPKLSKETSLLSSLSRTTDNVILSNSESRSLKNGTVVQVMAASGSNYRVELPDGMMGYIPSKKLVGTNNRIKSFQISKYTPVFDRPDTSAAVKVILTSGKSVDILGSFGNYDFIRTNEEAGWMLIR